MDPQISSNEPASSFLKITDIAILERRKSSIGSSTFGKEIITNSSSVISNETKITSKIENDCETQILTIKIKQLLEEEQPDVKATFHLKTDEKEGELYIEFRCSNVPENCAVELKSENSDSRIEISKRAISGTSLLGISINKVVNFEGMFHLKFYLNGNTIPDGARGEMSFSIAVFIIYHDDQKKVIGKTVIALPD